MYAQSCLPNGITFTSQSQIDSFPILYPNCSRIEGAVIITGSNITNLDSLIILTHIEGGLNIAHTPLTTFNGLDSLVSVEALFITNNDSMSYLSDFNSLSEIGTISIQLNDNIVAIDGFTALTTMNGGLDLYKNFGLMSITGFHNVVNLHGVLSIYECPLLQTIEGLENLQSLGAGLIIFRSLVNLSYFSNLREINGPLRIWESGMQSLSGLDSINPENIEYLSLLENYGLSDCAVESICQYIINLNGLCNIFDNAQGCNNQAEIEDACTVGLPKQELELSISAYPNPFTTSTTIEYELKEISNLQFTIYNVIGEVVYMTEDRLMPQGKHIFTWTADQLPEGLYYAVLRSEEGVSVMKMVKQ